MSDSGKAIIAKLENIKPISGADKIVSAEVLGEQVIVGISNKEGDVGIFFPAGLCVTKEFALPNKLYRKHPDTDDAMGGYLEANGRIRFVKMRGVVSRGLWLPLDSLGTLIPTSKGVSNLDIKLGLELDEYLGIKICKKYVNEQTQELIRNSANKMPRAKSVKYENFYEVGDTARMVYNLHAIKPFKDIIITEKLHGTSGRTGCLKKKHHPNFLDKLLSKIGFERKPVWGCITGTRRQILGENSVSKDEYRKDIHKILSPHLEKGQIIYYEIVGFDHNGKSIMPQHTLNNKPFYYSYGNSKYNAYPYSFYIYRIVGHDASDNPYEYSWDEIVKWCEQRKFEHVPVIDRLSYSRDNFSIGQEEKRRIFIEYIKEISDGPSLLDENHIREGVCIRIDNKVYKHKGNTFCLLEDIAPYADPEDAV